MKKTGWGFDTRDMDTRVRAQDDFFHFAGGSWMAREKMPENESRWGSFMILRKQVDEQIHALVKGLTKKRSKKGSLEAMIRDFLRSGMDTKRRDKLGLSPIAKHLVLIDSIKTPDDIIPTMAKLEKMGADGVWHAFVDQDMKNSERYLLHFAQGGLGMPDRDYYLKDDADSIRVRVAYVTHLKNLSRLARLSQDPGEESKRVYALELALAKVSMKKEDTRDPDKLYFKFSLAKLARLAPHIAWKTYLATIGTSPREVIVMQPKFFKALDGMLSSFGVEDWKSYLRVHTVNSFAGALSTPFVKENFAFYGTVLSGTKKMKPLWRRVLGAVQGAFGEALGRTYVEKYFPPRAKKEMLEMVRDLMTAYEARIRALDWMSLATKKKAIAKLHKISVKIGYPEKWKKYTGLTIVPDDYVGNIIRAGEWHSQRELKKLGKKVDRKEWFMFPHTVNAYYSASMNEIAFPAGILQPPFFDPSADDAINYGAIGSVIGHEVTHAFDDQGAKFDAVGNRKTWWQKKDKKKFEKKAKVLVTQFDKYSVAPGSPVNGKFTLSENIADLGGMSIAYDAYLLKLARAKREDIGGFSPEQRYFLGTSLFEREISRPEFLKMQVLTDSHSPGMFRVNGPVSNLPEFYKAFGVKKGDKLYREPKHRAKIW